jgi:hypothetical protein
MEKKSFDVLVDGELYAFCFEYETAINMAGNYVKRYPESLIEIKDEKDRTVWSSVNGN